MCGRFTLTADSKSVQAALQLGEMPPMEPRYNIAPSQEVAVVTDAATRDVALFRWGLVPFWAKEPGIGNRLINARSETVAEKPAFRAAFRKRRCLVLADGFYEWQKRGKEPSQPFFFRLEEGGPFAFAGLWEQWDKGDAPLLSCTILTGAANERVAPIHARQPIILPTEKMWQWLDPELPEAALLELLAPIGADELAAYPVSTAVNSPANDHAALLAYQPV